MLPYKKVFISSTNFTCQEPFVYKEKEVDNNVTINYSKFITKLDNLDQYELIDNKIGEGGFGAVFEVKYKLNNEIRAMKVIKKCSQDQNDNFRKEFNVLKRYTIFPRYFFFLFYFKLNFSLDHPNILKLYHSFEDEDFFYIVSEKCDGGSLYDYMMTQEKIQEKDICKIMYQLMTAVNLAHRNKIVHRDIKLENILLDDVDSIKLIDWGLLGKVDGEKLNQRCGSLHYVAPEVIDGSYDEKCDIWSCGVVLYILIANDPPFQGRDTQEVLQSIHSGKVQFKYKLWNRFSNEVKNLLTLMLEKDPQIRYSAQQVLEHPWFENRLSDYIASQEYKESLAQLNQFGDPKNQEVPSQRFLQAIVLFISTEVVHKKDKQILHKIFRKIDKNADGKISKEELYEAFQPIYPESELKQRVDRIFSFLDLNSSGYLDYSEFIAATLKLTDIENKLKVAFDFFDSNRDGSITFDELFKIIGPTENWKEIFNTFDSDHDQKISYQEFQLALQQYTQLFTK